MNLRSLNKFKYKLITHNLHFSCENVRLLDRNFSYIINTYVKIDKNLKKKINIPASPLNKISLYIFHTSSPSNYKIFVNDKCEHDINTDLCEINNINLDNENENYILLTNCYGYARIKSYMIYHIWFYF